jgi:flagellar hook protein FlgE
MLRSLFAGVSGMRNHQVRMDVIGNNISNVNTVAFKAGRVTFKEGFAQLLQGASRPPGDQGGINPIQVGLGMQIGSIDQMFGQGNIETTGQSTDLAIQGDSMFVVRKGNQSYYTRSGNFQLDADGRLVSPTNGFVVQGKIYNNGVLQDGIQDIKLPFGQKVSAKPTSRMTLAGNLNASSPAFQGDIADPDDRSNPLNRNSWTETTISVFDSQGTKQEVKILLYKLASPDNSWGWQIDPSTSSIKVDTTTTAASGGGSAPIALPTAPSGYEIQPFNVFVSSPTGAAYREGADYVVSGGNISFPPGSGITSGTQVTYSYFMSPTGAGPAGISRNSGTFTFDKTGIMVPGSDTPMIDFAVPGANPVQVELNVGGGVNGLTQFATASTAVLRDQDGYTAGQLQNFSIDRYGLITGFFTNGTTTPLGKIVLGDFNNPAGLLRVGDNMYQESANSGGAVLGFALEGSQSQITSGALEMSNVDLAQEFTSMIVAQRGFQANGKVVSTSDEMLQELMQLKR